MPYYQEALQSRRKKLGDDHPRTRSTLDAIVKISDSLQTNAKWEEATAYRTEALNYQLLVLGDTHPETLRTINTLAELHNDWHESEPDAGHDVEAEKYRQMLEDLRDDSNTTTSPSTP